ncbi:MAG: hypothetical protein Q7T33_14130 [Dehalococcoidia bacterium]|nr:hypothetical protein [Dehalococcoidia bacterium]
MRFWFKRCPRCRQGDLQGESDSYGSYIACMQCGYILSTGQEALLLGIRQAEEEPAPARQQAAA